MPSKIKIEIRAELRDRQGKLIKLFPWKPANSLLKAFIQFLAIQMTQANQTIKATDATSNSISPAAAGLKLNAAVNVTTWGMLIGTGITPVTMTDFVLETPITANIVHSVMTFAVENPDASTWRLSIIRIFTNNTGASLGIREVALYTNDFSVMKFEVLDHTLYSVDVPNGVAVTLTYRITVSL